MRQGLPRLESDDVSDVRNLSSLIPSLPTLWITLQSPLNSPLAKGQLAIACTIGFVTRCALCEKVSGAGGDGPAFGFLSRGTVTSTALNSDMSGRGSVRGCNSPQASPLEVSPPGSICSVTRLTLQTQTNADGTKCGSNTTISQRRIINSSLRCGALASKCIIN